MEDCSRERFFGDCCPDWKVLKKTPNVFFPSKFWVLLQRNSTTAFDPSSQLGLTRPINLEVFHFPFSDLRKIWTKGKKSNLIKILTPHPTPWEYNGQLDFSVPSPPRQCCCTNQRNSTFGHQEQLIKRIHPTNYQIVKKKHEIKD